jgi:anti-sigma regulatory factor (Ser/Thr protein kinase)
MYIMRVHIPSGAFLGNINHFLSGFDPSDPDSLTITAHEKWFWIHPAVLGMIAALGKPVNPDKITCEIKAKTGIYLERMGLYSYFGKASGLQLEQHEPAGRFIPLTQIKTSDDLTKFLTELIPLLHLEPANVEPIQYTMSELIRNVLEHAYSSEGAIVCAQYFKKSNTVRIGIVDRGVGLKESLKDSYAPETDMAAMRWALTPGITGTTRKIGGTEQNAGAGLFFIKTIAYVNRDPFLIYSGNAMYKLLKRSTGHITLQADPFKDRHSKEDDVPYWQGVVVGIDIKLDRAREFSELLRAIRDFYFKSVKEKKKEKAKLKKPKFV